MDIIDKINQYTINEEQRLNESFASDVKKYWPGVDVDNELIFVPGITLSRMYMNNNVWDYIASRIEKVTDKMAKTSNNVGFDEIIKKEFEKVKSQYDVKALNVAIWKVEDLRQPGKMGKKEQEEFKKFKSWLRKLTKFWLEDYKKIAQTLNLNTDKLASYNYGTSPKKEAQAFEAWVMKSFGVKYKSKNKEWG